MLLGAPRCIARRLRRSCSIKADMAEIGAMLKPVRISATVDFQGHPLCCRGVERWHLRRVSIGVMTLYG